MSTPVRLLVIDDHPVFRLGLVNLLRADSNFEVIAEGATGEEALVLAREHAPDLILMDIGMPGIGGIEATRRIVAAFPDVKVLMVTMFEDDSVFDAMKAGARGYVLKGVDPDDTLRSIRSAAAGEAVFSPAIARRLVSYFGRTPHGPDAVFPELSDREREVLSLVARGLTNAAIADQLYLSAKTVRNHVSNIFTKLHVASRAEAIVKARDAGVR